MQGRSRRRDRIIAYGMVLLLLVNLLSGSVKGDLVMAEGSTETEAAKTPSVKVAFTAEGKTLEVNSSGGIVSNKDVTIEYTLENVDDESGEEPASYTLVRTLSEKKENSNQASDETENDEDLGEGDASQSGDGEKTTTFNDEKAFDNEKKITETLKAEDGKVLCYTMTYYLKKGSNQIGDAVSFTLILDWVNPELTVTDNSEKVNENGFFDSFTLTSSVADRGTCQVSVKGTRTYLSDGGEVVKEDINKNVDYVKKDNTIEDGGASPDLESVTFEDYGNYEVYVEAVDDAGNVTKTDNYSFLIDSQEPMAAISGVSNNAYYKENVELSFSLKDMNISEDEKDYKIQLKKDGETYQIEDNQKDEASSKKAWTVSKDGYLATKTLTLTEEGSYEVTFKGTDKNGNTSKIAKVNFIIDKTRPVAEINVSYDNEQNKAEPVERGEVEDGKSARVLYLKDDAKVSYTVSEYYYGEAEAHIGAICNGEIVNEESINPMESNPQTICRTYSNEGRYKAYVWAKDKAGNVSDGDISSYFVIDKTEPEFSIDIEGVQGSNPFCVSPAKLKITAADCNHDTSTYQIIVERTDNQGIVTKREIDPGSSDNSANGWTQTQTNGNLSVLEYDLEISQEGNYTVTVSGKDKAGNQGQEARISFRIDNTKPVITLSSVTDNGYYNSNVELSVLVQELNYEETDVEVWVNRELNGVAEETTGKLNLTALATRHLLTYTEEGNYTVVVTAKDGAGNEADARTIHFVIDKTAPALSITGIDNQGMTKNAVAINLRAVDYNHDFSQYRLSYSRSDIEGELESGSYTYGETEWKLSGTAAEKQIFFTQEGKYEITFEAVDRAGNVAQSRQLVFSIDATAPVISGVVYSDVNGRLGQKYNNIYSNQAILVEFTVKDQVVGVNDGKVYVTVGKPEGKDETTNLYIAHKTVGNSYYVYVPTDLNVSEFDDTITIWANDMLGNESSYISTNLIFNTSKPLIQMNCDTDYTKWTNKNVTFHTRVTDEKAGIKEIVYKIDNETVKKVTFKESVTAYSYDLTAKDTASKVSGYTVSVEVVNNCGTSNTMQKRVYIDKVKPKVALSGIANGTHYNNGQTFTTTVQDVSYKNTKTVYYITRTLDGKQTTMSAAAFRSKKYQDTCNRKMINEGQYKIYAVTTDSAGNKSRSNTLSFVIDKTAPELSITGVKDGAMNSAAVNLEFGCTESFFATNQVNIEVERTLDGTTVTEQLEGFPNTSKKASMSHSFSEDGTYRITISATDKAGNVATPQTITFSVDQTKPVIRITGTDNYQQWKEPATIQFSVEESYYSGNEVEITGTKRDIDGNVTELELPKFSSMGKVSNLTQMFDGDGVYELEIVSKDQAGNQDSEKIHFTVDRTNPKISGMKEYDGGYYQEFKLADSLEEVFKDLTVVSYRMTLNGIEYDGTSTVQDEGKYTLDVEVSDELGHTSSEQVEFIIDHTAPKVIFSGANDGETVHEKGMVNLSLTNSEDEITGVRMNGVDYGADTRNLSYTEYGSYQIDVDCVDKAGNSITRSIYFVYNNPLTDVLIFAGMGVLLLSTCGWLWVRTKRKEKEERKHDESSSI